MEFFTENNLEVFSNLIDTEFKKNTSEADLIRLKLTENGVFDKTAYWAQLLEKEGFSIDGKMMWQFSGRVRKYSWAKVYLAGFENTDIYFTIGVGSRLVQDSNKCSLVYKIDCQRKRGSLSPYQIEAFDDYLQENNLDWVRRVETNELTKYSWERLLSETLSFINVFETHYRELVYILWPNGIGVSSKVARLCWNDLGWERPSGMEGKSRNANHTFESKGYGHEEWLFDLNRSLNGYQYGFIQAFNKGEHFGKTYDLHRYTMKREVNVSSCYWVGRIKRIHVLTKKEQKEVFQLYKEKGWYPEMMKELQDVGVEHRDLEIVSEEELFNVKFKIDSENFIRFDPLIFISEPKLEISKGYGRYNLKDLITKTESVLNTSNRYVFRSGYNPTKTGTSKSIYSTKTVNRSLKHKEVQEYMYIQLIKEKGSENVGTEVPTGRGTSIDMVVVQSDMSEWFYEVKTYNQPLVCIREAFGQILEYAMFSNNRYAKKLIIVGLNRPSTPELDYLQHLRDTTKLPVFYQVFDTSKKELIDKLY